MGAAKESWGLVASTTVRGKLAQLDGSVCLIGSGARCRPRETGFLREPGAPPFPLDRRYRMKWASCAHGPIGRRDDVFFWGGGGETLLSNCFCNICCAGRYPDCPIVFGRTCVVEDTIAACPRCRWASIALLLAFSPPRATLANSVCYAAF